MTYGKYWRLFYPSVNLDSVSITKPSPLNFSCFLPFSYPLFRMLFTSVFVASLIPSCLCSLWLSLFLLIIPSSLQHLRFLSPFPTVTPHNWSLCDLLFAALEAELIGLCFMCSQLSVPPVCMECATCQCIFYDSRQ